MSRRGHASTTPRLAVTPRSRAPCRMPQHQPHRTARPATLRAPPQRKRPRDAHEARPALPRARQPRTDPLRHAPCRIGECASMAERQASSVKQHAPIAAQLRSTRHGPACAVAPPASDTRHMTRGTVPWTECLGGRGEKPGPGLGRRGARRPARTRSLRQGRGSR